VWGTLAAAAASIVIAGLYLRTGFGYAFDFTFAIVVAAVLIPLAAVVVALDRTAMSVICISGVGFGKRW